MDGVSAIAYPLSQRLALLPIAAAIWTTSVANSGGSADAPQLVEMPQIVVPIIGSDRIDGALRVTLVLSAHDPAALARLTQRLPELRAVSVASTIEFSRLYASARTPVNAVKLRSVLTAALHAKDEGVADTLIVEISAAA